MRLSRSLRPTGRALLAIGAFGGLCLTTVDARAQVAGTNARPLPNVMLLVDTSGSMEKKADGSTAVCTPGTATDPNRWGMLLQALTGNIQPFFSCASVTRATGSPFQTRYSINGKPPYDLDYAADYHQPLSPGATQHCAVMPWKLPGASTGSGVGTNKLGVSGTKASEFPDEALASVYYDATSTGLTASIPATSQCVFEQTPDGQLDAARDYARFALMTFDSDTHSGLGVDASDYVLTTDPFKGQWSYLRSPLNPLFTSASNQGGTFIVPADATPNSARGMPGTTPACTTMSLQEVGGRNASAPPWEGRLVPFPAPDASIYEIARQNQQIQQVLLATRPYGATPIDGMMDDARDFYWYNPAGPNGTTPDPYACRDKYIILLTDGAPNLDLRPSCANPGGVCPYPKTAGQIAQELATASTQSQRVTTYVIGFSVNGTGAPGTDGFPSGISDCKSWFDASVGGATTELQKATNMKAVCDAVATRPAAGTTGRACCELNEIALQGSGTGAYFAKSQADIVLSFGKIMANIIRSASTKTPPVMANATFETTTTTSTASSGRGLFLSSFIPSSQRPWSGELDRTRYKCDASRKTVPDLPQDANKGDFMSENVAEQSMAKKRRFISVLADTEGAIDSAATIRPFANRAPASSTGSDGIIRPAGAGTTYSGTEVSMTDNTIIANWPEALNITNKTCKRGRAIKTGDATGTATGRGSVDVPALDGATGAADCTKVVWGFTTATPDSMVIPPSTGYEFNTRCRMSLATAGTCSISGGGCVPSANPGTCPTGEACIPKCAALGAVYHSTPAAVSAPESTSREEGFRAYQANRRTRRTVIYTATTDGVLHAFKALDQGTQASGHELWAFVPPAVLPKLASNYPAGNQIILDGAPAVRETLWDRKTSDATAAKDWHTTLVAGLGTTGGYYALNVTDADCGGTDATPGACFTNYEAPTQNDPKNVANSGNTADALVKKGPHFLWQLTDVSKDTGVTDPAKPLRKSTLTGTPDMVSLFGKNTGTPAVGTVAIRTASDGDHLVGVAILPGGYDEAPVGSGYCARVSKTTAQVDFDKPYRDYVRKWEKNCSDPVPGRGVTLVRLDNGEIIRHFGRKLVDVPARVQAKTIDSPFDSPMTGTPVVYPDKPGVPIQKVYIGDADGTVWRLDLTSANPDNWKATLFADIPAYPFSATPTPPAPSTTGAAALSQPIQVTPVISLDESGSIVLNVATGDQENIVYDGSVNFIASLRETRDPDTAFKVKAETQWYKALPNERVTGPMTVFDRVLYFASYEPQRPASASASCDGLGVARLWGMHYTIPSAGQSTGGRAEWCTLLASGVCDTGIAKTQFVAEGSALIPGVTLTRSLSCVDPGSSDAYGNGGYANVTQTEFSLSFGQAKPSSGASGAAQADRLTRARPVPLVSSRIDSWSLVVE